MAIQWTNNGEAVNGQYEAVIDLENGSQPQRFRGASHKEVADKLLDAQAHASRRIQELRAAVPPQPAKKPLASSVPLSADERMQLARDITDPAKSDAAVERLLLAKGINLEEVRQIIRNQREQEEAQTALTEAQAFAAETPNWFPSDYNKQTLVAYMQSHNMAATRNNFALAFDALLGANLLQRKPEEAPTEDEPETAAERIAPATSRPRSAVSTGLRNTQGRTTPPPAAPRSKYTKRDIQNMSAQEYARRLTSEPGFAAAVEAAR